MLIEVKLILIHYTALAIKPLLELMFFFWLMA